MKPESCIDSGFKNDSVKTQCHLSTEGRKRHLVTDTTGIPLMIKVADANVSDNQIAIELLTEVFSWCVPKLPIVENKKAGNIWLIRVDRNLNLH